MAGTSDAFPRKMKLRRLTALSPLSGESSDIIQKNLEPLKVNSLKKKIAQDYYYENAGDEGNSPMMRPMGRPSVKQRLGRVPYFGTNTSMVPPKGFRRQIVKQNVTQNRIITRRVNATQQRLYRIRNNQRIPQMFKHRTIINNPKPSSYKVEVPNGSFTMYNRGRRFKQIINRHIQQEIQILQKNLPVRETLLVTKVTPVTTKITLHERFGALF